MASSPALHQPRRTGRPKLWAENMTTRFALGTFARVAAVLVEGEDRTDFVRVAVEHELRRREGERTQEPRP